MESGGVMKKVNVKYHIDSFDKFNAEFQGLLDVFSDGASHLEITLVMDELDNRNVSCIVNSIARNPTFKDIANETIYTFVAVVAPSMELAKTFIKIKGLLSRIDLVSNEENLSTTAGVFLALQKKKLPCSVIIRESNIDEIIRLYRRLTNIGVTVFVEGEVSYNEKFNILFKEWLYDKNGCRLNIFADILSRILLDYWGSKCQFKSCLTKYFSVETDGTIYSCKDTKNKICSLSEIGSVNEIISNDNFVELLKQSVIKRAQCKEHCKFYELCQGGCPLNSNISISECAEKQLFVFMESVSELLYPIIQNSDYRNLNPAVREMILSSVASNKLFEKGIYH